MKKTDSSRELARLLRAQSAASELPRGGDPGAGEGGGNPGGDAILQAFCEEVLRAPRNAEQIEWIHTEPERGAQFADPGPDGEFHGLDPRWRDYLASQGIEQLYSHQARALESIGAGRHVVVVSATASGKSLCYNLPVLDYFLKGGKGYALYLFPTKALAQDQMRTLDQHLRGLELDLEAGVFDGDTEPTVRRRLRQRGRLILTNPDMLHRAILPHHGGWAGLFRGLRFVVIDEVHSLRGIFGSNVANVLRRLRRLAERYGSRPQLVGASATIANPSQHAAALIGQGGAASRGGEAAADEDRRAGEGSRSAEPSRELAGELDSRDRIDVIDQDGSPRGARTVVFWNPPVAERPDGSRIRKGPLSVAVRVLPELLRRGVRTIAFCQARSTVELVLRYVWDRLRGNRSTEALADKLQSYRAGYLPRERREIERRLFDGELLGVVSTNALELGIDIGGLDACLLVGYPGTVASFQQRAGRAGRRAHHSLVIFIGGTDPIDQYFMRHPESFFQKPLESAVIEPQNPYILTKHLVCAAYELPLREEDARWFTGGDVRLLRGILELLCEAGQLREAQGAWHYVEDEFPARKVKLRTVADENFTIYEGKSHRIIGELDYVAGLLSLYEGAIYIHRSETHFVEELDVVNQIARLRKDDSGYYTQALLQKKVQVDEPLDERPLPRCDLRLAEVTVETRITGFKKVRFQTVENIGYGEVDLPPILLQTVAAHFDVSEDIVDAAMFHGSDFFHSGLHGVCRLTTSLMPFFVMGDPRDIDYFVDGRRVYVYDLYEGGIGYAEKAYEIFERILQASLDHARECGCPAGCPSCVLPSSSRYEIAMEPSIREYPYPKEAAKFLLHALLDLEPYEPSLDAVELTARPSPVTPEEPLDPRVARKVRRAARTLRPRTES